MRFAFGAKPSYRGTESPPAGPAAEARMRGNYTDIRIAEGYRSPTAPNDEGCGPAPNPQLIGNARIDD